MPPIDSNRPVKTDKPPLVKHKKDTVSRSGASTPQPGLKKHTPASVNASKTEAQPNPVKHKSTK